MTSLPPCNVAYHREFGEARHPRQFSFCVDPPYHQPPAHHHPHLDMKHSSDRHQYNSALRAKAIWNVSHICVLGHI